VRDIQELYDLPPDAFHHTIDVAMQDLTASTGGRIRTAIVCPPDIYGQPEGVTERATHMVPNYVRVVLEKGTGGFYLGSGQNYRAVSHLSDVSQLFALIVGEALKPDGGKATWGKEGFYFGVASEVRWKEAAEAIQKILVKQGLVDPNAEVESWPKEKFVGLLPQLESWFPEITLYFWGSNSRAVSERATNLLGWEARGPTFFEALEADVLVVVDEINKSKGKL
jgi:nucleoside-diphosphate-sugar epimerase